MVNWLKSEKYRARWIGSTDYNFYCRLLENYMYIYSVHLSFRLRQHNVCNQNKHIFIIIINTKYCIHHYYFAKFIQTSGISLIITLQSTSHIGTISKQHSGYKILCRRSLRGDARLYFIIERNKSFSLHFVRIIRAVSVLLCIFVFLDVI